MKKRILSLFLMPGLLFIVAGCSSTDNSMDLLPSDFEPSYDSSVIVPQVEEIEVSITFAKDFKKTNIYQQNDEEVTEPTPLNEDIYVFVNFKFNNIREVDDKVALVIGLKPGTDTYDRYDYLKGTQIPSKIEDEKFEFDDDGVSTVIEISGMNFVINANTAVSLHEYCFRIRVIKEIVEPSVFSVKFSPGNDFNDGRNKTVRKTHFTG